jgi:TPP-dependent pyruvate/acetoin dehydrogenase alpha subunit
MENVEGALGMIGIIVGAIALVVFFMFHTVPSDKQIEDRRKRELEENTQQWLDGKEPIEPIEPTPLSLTTHTQQAIVSKLQEELSQATAILDKLKKEEELSKLSKEELFDRVYSKESTMDNLSQDEMDSLLKVLTKLRSSKE